MTTKVLWGMSCIKSKNKLNSKETGEGGNEMIISCMAFSLQCVLGLISVFLCIQQKTGPSLIL